MYIPKQVEYILNKLNAAGYEGYLVGGCVRDYLLSKEPSDFDVATNALPEKTAEIFADDKVIPTGLKHGTVTVIHCGCPFEITTYRTETTYTDGRHPDSVSFTLNLADDLCRRDFTVNAMAMGLDGVTVDLYGGRKDLEGKIIRAVGDPKLRFTEDALRILRAFRFASKLGFEIEEETLKAAAELSPRLSLVSRERVFAELEKLLVGKSASKILKLMEEHKIFDSILKNPDINRDAFSIIDGLPARADVRLAALIFKDKNAASHISSLKTSADFSSRVKRIIDCEIPSSLDLPTLRRAIYLYGGDALADCALVERNTELYRAVSDLLENENCFSVSDLKISGSDIIENTDLRGREIGEKLTEVLFAVFDEKIRNTYEEEIALIKS
ncbi:MAG: CCA tRNA nucleotidyltransferase [Clostridia bacterium]|nr:CCA tRNA nucleotidyltransferase [Clostridia bacterium]